MNFHVIYLLFGLLANADSLRNEIQFQSAISEDEIFKAHQLEISEAYVTDLDKVETKFFLQDETFLPEQRSFSYKTPHPGNLFKEHRSYSLGRDDSDDCGFCDTSIRKGDNGTISSPNFPQPYPASEQHCLWLLQTKDSSRIRLTCDVIELQSCGRLGRESPKWSDYLIISPLWTFKKSWVYCGKAVTISALRHESICDQMAITFKSDGNPERNKGFRCQYEAV